MRTYEFDVILNGVREVTDDQADALFAAGCDDGTPACSNGLSYRSSGRGGVNDLHTFLHANATALTALRSFAAGVFLEFTMLRYVFVILLLWLATLQPDA